jgi:hypothetical protein
LFDYEEKEKIAKELKNIIYSAKFRMEKSFNK